MTKWNGLKKKNVKGYILCISGLVGGLMVSFLIDSQILCNVSILVKHIIQNYNCMFIEKLY